MSDEQKIKIQVPFLRTPPLLFLVLLFLKVTHVIDWSWWWITAPLWLPYAIIFATIGFVLMIAIIGAIANASK